MRRISVCVIGLLIVNSILWTFPTFAQQRNRVVRPAEKTKQQESSLSRHGGLPLKKVVLYSNGVGYFERQGEVTGNSTISFQFTPEEIDDVLKSMVILDHNNGRVSSVNFDTAKPLNVALSEFGFDLNGEKNDGAGFAKMLSTFPGAAVEARQGENTFVGKIMGVERRVQPVGDSKTDSYSLTIINDKGEARSFPLSQLGSIRLLDPRLREDVARYLNLLDTARRKDNKTVEISATGEGTRQMSVSYTVAAPVWKTSYRIVMNGKGESLLQGWAIVDNVTDEDWENVDLSLISGKPISFIQNLKQPLYRHRPVVAMSQGYDVMPQNPEADEAKTRNAKNTIGDAAVYVDGFLERGRIPPRLPGGMSGRNAILPGSEELKSFPDEPEDMLMVLKDMAGPAGSVAETTTESIGELFQYHIAHPVTIQRNHSALIPIVQTQVGVEPVSVYTQQSGQELVLNGIRLKNSTGLTLDAGPITVIEGNTYSGEALIDRIKPDETRLITYAVDLGVRVTKRNGSERQSVTKIQVADDAMYMTIKSVWTSVYKINNISDTAKTLIVEHPRRNGFNLISKVEPDSNTPHNYRFRINLKPHESTEFVVKEEQPEIETFKIDDMKRDQMALVLKENYFAPELKQKLSQIMDLKEKIDSVDAEIARKQKTLETISSDQQRLRENIKVMGQSAEERKLVSRYVAKLEEDETTIGKLRAEITDISDSKTKIEEEIAGILRSLVTG